MSATPRTVALAVLLAALAAAASVTAHADETAIADLSQGTNMTVALAPNAGTLVVGLVDQLWRVPAPRAARTASAMGAASATSHGPLLTLRSPR